MDGSPLHDLIQGSALAKALRAGAAIGMVQAGSCDSMTLGVGVHRSTPVEIGSLTKVFTALLLAQAVERHELDLSARVDELLFSEPWPGNGAAITALDLATHHSGLPRLPLSMRLMLPLIAEDPYRNASHRGLLRYLRRKRPTQSPAPKFAYSNLGFAVLGLMLERATGQSYATLLQDRLLDPVSLAATHLALTDGPDFGTHGHNRRGGPVPAWHWKAYAPCGGLVSTLDDLLTLLTELQRERGLLASARDLATTPRAEVRGGSIGLAWLAPSGGAWSWHNGATFGHAAFLGLAPARGVGVAIVCNQYLGGEVTQLGNALMRQLLA